MHAACGQYPGAPPTGYAVQGARSVRHYKRENVSPGLLQELLDSAAYAPTGSNAQNLLVSVVDDIAAMDALREAVYLRLDELAETGAMPDCQRRAFFLSAGKIPAAYGLFLYCY